MLTSQYWMNFYSIPSQISHHFDVLSRLRGRVCTFFWLCGVCVWVSVCACDGSKCVIKQTPWCFSLFIYLIFKFPKALSNLQWKIGFFLSFSLLLYCMANSLTWCDIIISHTSNNFVFSFSEKFGFSNFEVM